MAAVACICLFFVVFFAPDLFGGKYVFTGDGFFYSYPLRTVAWRMIRHGELPLWTPYILSGYPLLSMAQIGLAYPLTWGYMFLPGHVAEQVYVLAPFLLAPIFTYAYLRKINRSRLASLLGALTFGYGGLMASPLANNGLLPNACMWMPLMLIALERSCRHPLVPCLIGATAAYTMSVLTGIGQGFLYVALVAGAYALFLVLVGIQRERRSLRNRLFTPEHWRPLIVAGVSILLSAGIAAFQLLETARAMRRSVRSNVSYEIFTQGSFTPAQLWRSVFEPLFYVIDMSAYVTPVALLLAIVAIYAHARGKDERDLRVFFWLIVAAIAYVLMLGAYTPLYPLVYRMPVLNLFRVPSRHTFEWSFAIGVMAAYGWDSAARFARRLPSFRERRGAFTLYPALALLVGALVVGAVWWFKTRTLSATVGEYRTAARHLYQVYKVAFVLLTCAALWRSSLIPARRWRRVILSVTVMLTCFVEPSLLVARWWIPIAASRFGQETAATRFLQQYPPSDNRIYTRVDLMSEQFGDPPRFDNANLSALYGLQNVAGYEPLILERYSRALGGAGLDSVNTFSSNGPDPSLFSTRSRVLDLLNTSFVVSYPNLATSLAGSAVPRAATQMEVIGEVLPQTTKTLVVQSTDADGLMFITSLSNSTSERDGETVARVRIITSDKKIIEREIQAGRDTAEWAHERPDVRRDIKHKLATPFDEQRVGGEKGFTAYRYKTSIKLDQIVHVTRVEITNVSAVARLGIYGALLTESRSQRSVPLTVPYSADWQAVYDQEQTLILHNTRVCPRAWLVTQAEAVDGDEARRRIRGESLRDFEPRRTALLEVHPNELPTLPGGEVAADTMARMVSYEPSRLVIETASPTANVLVVSEIFYPGWEATVDGQRSPILLTDYILRGVALTAGHHRVEMRYTAPAARMGAIISICTLLLLCGLYVYSRRRRVS